MRPLRVSWSLLAIGLVTICAAWAYITLEGTAGIDGDDGSFVTFVVGLLLIAGLLMCRRRPDSWSGPLVQLSSMLAFAGQARFGMGAVGPVAGLIWLAAPLVPGALALVEIEVARRALRAFLLGPVALSVLLGTAVVLAARGRTWANSLWWQTAKQQAGHALARALVLARRCAGRSVVGATR